MKKKVFIFFILLLSSAITCSAQSLDSLWVVAKDKQQPDTNRIKALDDLAWSYTNKHIDSAVVLAEQGLGLAKKLSFDTQRKWESRMLSTLGGMYMKAGNYAKALDCYGQGLVISEKNGDTRELATFHINIGNIHSKQGDFPTSLKFLLKASKMLEGSKYEKLYYNACSLTGTLYYRLMDYDKAGQFFTKAYNGMKKLGKEHAAAKEYFNIGIVSMCKSEHEKALGIFAEAMKTFKKFEDKEAEGNCVESIGLVYQRQGDFRKSLDHSLASLKIRKAMGDKPGTGANYVNLSNISRELGEYGPALSYADSALHIARDLGIVNMERLSFESLSLTYSKMKDFRKAFESHVEFKRLTDSIFNLDNSRQLSDLKTQFEVDKKEAELKAKAYAEEQINLSEKNKQRMIMYAIAAVLLIVLVFSFLLYKRFLLTNKQKVLIEQQKVMVDKAFDQLHEKNKEIVDSINYARRIQRSQLPTEKYIERNLQRLKG